MKDFFTSDTHFFHGAFTAAGRIQNRPQFKDEYEMNDVLIKNWNSVVQPEDRVFHAGDFAVGLRGRDQELRDLAAKLNGQIFLIRGNHERAAEIVIPNRFGWIRDYHEYSGPRKVKIMLFHYACRVWNASHHGTWHLYGHSHGDLPENPGLSCDIGVDAWNFTPVSLEQIASKMNTKSMFLAANGITGDWDHHGRKDDVPIVGRAL